MAKKHETKGSALEIGHCKSFLDLNMIKFHIILEVIHAERA
jgi:hypothetical protein